MRTPVLCLIVLCLAAACGSNEPSEDTSRCLQTSEFGNTGCGELQGRVIDTEGAPLPSAHVDVRGSADPARPVVLISGFLPTDSTGHYKMRVTREIGEAPPQGPDTITVWVHASFIPDDTPVGTSGPGDSVLATLELRPVGETPVIREVQPIALALPWAGRSSSPA